MRHKGRGKKEQNDEVVSPLDFLGFEEEEAAVVPPPPEEPRETPVELPAAMGQGGKKGRAIFITGTDTGVGKTYSTAVLGLLLKDRGLKVGIMKPVQCGGEDAKFLTEMIESKDSAEEINPFFARDPISPHLAFRRQNKEISVDKIAEVIERLRERHDVVLIEGVGGLMVPLRDDYLVGDMVRDLGLELVIVSRLGLGTINHTLLTIQHARDEGIRVRGVIFNEKEKVEHGLSERSNPQTIRRLGHVPVLGIIPFFSQSDSGLLRRDMVHRCRRRVDLAPFLRPEPADHARQLAMWDKKYLWHPFTQMKDWLEEDPLIIERGKGSYLVDVDGRAYIDGVASLWVNLHGHRRRELDNALKAQINKLSHSTLLGLSHPPAIELARKLVAFAPRGIEKVFYSDNGSTAVEVAVKMAYQYWQNTGKPQKTKIAHLSHAYHGDTLGSVSVGGIDLFHKMYERLTFESLPLEFPDFYRAPEGKTYPQYTEECLANMERIFAEQHESLAALVVEPLVQAAAGMIVWPAGILKKIRDLCTRHDVLLIADEVATGFGRTGKMFACDHEGVTPDFLCVAKGLTGGYLPLAATLTTSRVFDGFLFDYKDQKAFFHGHTYTGNPLACAVALANLESFDRAQVLRRLGQRIKYVHEKLQAFAQLPAVGDIRQKGFMIGIELVRDRERKIPFAWEEKIGVRVCQEARKLGVILRPLGNVIVLMPPLSIGHKEMDQLLDVAYRSIAAVTGGAVAEKPSAVPVAAVIPQEGAAQESRET